MTLSTSADQLCSTSLHYTFVSGLHSSALYKSWIVKDSSHISDSFRHDTAFFVPITIYDIILIFRTNVQNTSGKPFPLSLVIALNLEQIDIADMTHLSSIHSMSGGEIL